MAIRNFRDVLSGSIIKSKKGKTYLCLVDETGNKALFDKDGKFSRVDLDSLHFGKNNSGEVDSIYQFQTLPILDAISEGIKYVFRPDRPACAPLTKVYTSEPAEVTAARKALADAQAAADRARAVMAAYGF